VNEVFTLPVGVVRREVFDVIQKAGGSVQMNFLGWDSNPWDILLTGPYYRLYQALLIIPFLVNFCFAGYRLFRWCKSSGLTISVGLLCIISELICNLLRVIQMVLVPIYNVYHLFAVDIVTTGAICLSVASGILTVFFWFDLTTDPFYHGKFLGVMKKPAIIFICCLFAIEVIIDVLRYTIISLVDFVSGFYLVMHIILAIFYFVAASKILKTKIENRVRRISYRVIGSGVAACVSGLFIALWTSDVSNTPAGFGVTWYFTWLSFFFQSYLLIWIFNAPKKLKPSQPSTSDLSSNVGSNTSALTGTTTDEEKEN